MKTEALQQPYSHAAADVLAGLESRKSGLTQAEAQARLAQFGENQLPQARTATFWEVVWHQFASPLIYILMGAAVLALLLQEYMDALFIALVLLLNAGIGTWQEWRAAQMAANLRTLLKPYVTVRRDGKTLTIAAVELVPGDIVLLESGVKVPADLRLISADELMVDEAILTGESLPARKYTDAMAADTPVTDRANMAKAGSTVVSGRGMGVVTATGKDTEIGKLSDLVASTASLQPPLVIRLNRFAKQVAIVVLFCAAALVGWGLWQGLALEELLLLAVSLAVSAIPEGLPVVITVVLAVAATRMASRNVIVRRMSAVEGLGSCTMIASDKTGTLTFNMQTLQRIGLPGNQTLEVTGQGYNGTGQVQTLDGQKPNDALLAQAELFARAAALCNEGTLTQNADGQAWEHTGDAVDVAFLALAYKIGLVPAALHQATQFVGTLPFESERKFAAVYFQEGETVRIAIKGALETILPRCTQAQGGALDAEAITAQADAFTRAGFRVLGVAQGALPAADFDPKRLPDYLQDLELLGVAALQDPLRPEVPAAIAKCHAAGIQVCMITGDHPLTALAIAKQLGIAEGEADIITGRELEALGDAEGLPFREAVSRKRVFARTSPLQKLQIASALDKLGHFVAMTGDGVNDVPALKKAHISVAMGSGTDMAKDTSDLLLTDDNFASLEAGVEEGRYAYDNIRKVTYLLIATGVAEILLFFLALLAGLPLPLLAAQILWLNLVTNGIQDVAMGFEAGEPGAMQRPPRSRNEGIFNRLMISQVLVSSLTMAGLGFGVWWYLNTYTDYAPEDARSYLLLLFVFMQNVHVFNCRSERRTAFGLPLSGNWLLPIGVLAAQGIHQLAAFIPYLNDILQIRPMPYEVQLTMFGLSIAMLVVMELFKLIYNRWVEPQTAAKA